VRQAAYELIPEDQRRPVHLRVGRLLLTQGHPDPPEDLLFEIVNHLNYAGDLVTDPDERIGLLRLNLRAGHKAKESAAFAAALDYFQRGLRLLPEDGWETHYDLALALTMQVAEGEYLCGRFAAAEERFETLLRRARTPLQKAEAERMRIMQYDSLARYAEALRAGREGLTRLGVALPEDAAEAERALDRELALIQAGLADRPIASLQHLPEMQDAETRMVVALSTAVWASAYILGHRGLASLLSARIVRASLEHGNTADSAYGYVTHAIAVGPFRGDYGSAYEWGALALRVNEALGDKKGRARVQQQFHAHVNLWRRPLATCLPHAREACRSGLETGDFTYAGYGAFTETWAAFFTSRDLERFIREYEPTVALLQRIRRSTLASAQQLFLAWAKALQGRTRGPLSLSHAGFDEDRYASAHREDPFCLTFLHAARLHLGVTFEDPVFALEAARRARAEAWQAEGTLWPVFQSFWRGLALAALHGRATASEGRASRAEIESTLDSLRVLEDNCAENFRLFRLLLEAEARRIGSSPAQAADLLEEAIAWAKRTDNLQGEALANELAARLWLTRGRDALAAAYLGEARRAYLSWGATAKADELRARHPHLLGAAAAATAPSSESVPLDMATVLKAARALAVNIDLRGLLRELMRIALENAGAQRAVFIQEREGRLCVEAEADAEGGEPRVLRSLPLEQAGGVSPGVVRYVHRTGQEVVLGEAATDDRFAADAYIARCAPRSVLCAPVVNHGRTAGILYLENSLTSHAFTARRVEIMQVLTAEAAIALDNARLYEGMKEEVARRRQAEEALRAALGELEKVKDRLEAENVYLQEEIRTQHNFEEIVGNSPALVATLHQVERVAPTGSSVLIYGETGTGKELVARAIHSRSARRDRPLVKVNCGAIAPGLVESELFGHVKGAFTGALQSRAGRFALADRGTIFLDEVSELPPDTQVKLLRVLQEQEFEPVGSPRTVRVDVRVIAASNRRLDEAVQNGSFRADLLYRLNVFPLEVPPLRDRRADLPLLVAFFVARLAKTLGKPLEGVSRRSMERLLAYAWPGNVRELQNVIERAAILAPGPLIEIDPLSSAGPPDGEAGPRTIEVVEREHIARALRSTRGVIEGPRGAASILGLHPNTLRSRMKRLGVDRRADESP
jgi:transcriptional regulator with GAF, ATPase, and Fis domain